MPLRRRAVSEGASVHAAIRARHPRFFEAVFADARSTAAYRGERFEFTSTTDAVLQSLRLCWEADAFGAQVAYRLKARCQTLGIPVIPRLAHRWAMASAQVCIGDPVVIAPGLYLAHGQVVIDGVVEIDKNVIIFPWVTIGLRAGDVKGPRIGHGARIGTGAKIIGPVTVGAGAKIGANAVVNADVAPNATAVGVPAKVVRKQEGPARSGRQAKPGRTADTGRPAARPGPKRP